MVKLEKIEVCAECFSYGINYLDCVCTYQKNYPTVLLEFEVCTCCGHIISDGTPADTEYNNKVLEELQNKQNGGLQAGS